MGYTHVDLSADTAANLHTDIQLGHTAARLVSYQVLREHLKVTSNEFNLSAVQDVAVILEADDSLVPSQHAISDFTEYPGSVVSYVDLVLDVISLVRRTGPADAARFSGSLGRRVSTVRAAIFASVTRHFDYSGREPISAHGTACAHKVLSAWNKATGEQMAFQAPVDQEA